MWLTSYLRMIHAARSLRPRSVAAGTFALMAVTLGAGCTDLRDYSGSWQGEVLADSAVRVGFEEGTMVAPLRLTLVTLQEAEGELTTSDGRFTDATLHPLGRAASDALASISFDGDPLRTYLLYAEATGSDSPTSAVVILSLFESERIELRIADRDQLYGIFPLHR